MAAEYEPANETPQPVELDRQPGVPPPPRPNAKFKASDDGSKRKAKRNGAPERQDSIAPQKDPEPIDADFELLVQTLRQHRRRILRLPGVVAVDVGYKIKKGVFLNDLAIRVHVERKLPEKYFEEHLGELLSRSDGFGKKLGPRSCFDPDKKLGIFDVIEAKYRPSSPSVLPRRGAVLETPLSDDEIDRRRRLDPLVGGISIGSPDSTVGTLGAIVWDTTDGSVCILSNWHVLAGHAHAGTGTPCFQPGPFDRGKATDIVARLKRWSFDRQTDAAIAELTGSRHYCAGEILGMDQQIADETDPYLGMRVRKSGRSTSNPEGYVEGFVDGLYFSTAIEYSNRIMQTFEDQIHIAPVNPDDRISEPGDSGAVWVTEANGHGYLAVGLHFAGDLLRSAFGEYAIANPMTVVTRNLDFSFRPRFLEIRDEDVLTLPLTSGLELGNGNGNGNGGRPIGLIAGRLSGSGGHEGDPIEIPPHP